MLFSDNNDYCRLFLGLALAILLVVGCSEQPSSEMSTKGLVPYPLAVCVVSGEPLDSMDEPVAIEYEGREIRFCCESCVQEFKKTPAKYLAKIDEAAKTEQPLVGEGNGHGHKGQH